MLRKCKLLRMLKATIIVILIYPERIKLMDIRIKTVFFSLLNIYCVK